MSFKYFLNHPDNLEPGKINGVERFLYVNQIGRRESHYCYNWNNGDHEKRFLFFLLLNRIGNLGWTHWVHNVYKERFC